MDEKLKQKKKKKKKERLKECRNSSRKPFRLGIVNMRGCNQEQNKEENEVLMVNVIWLSGS